jgi:DnaJ-class molecular chaperone
MGKTKRCGTCHGMGSIANGGKLLACGTCGGSGVVRK